MNEQQYRSEVAFLTECSRRFYETIFGESDISDHEFDRRRRIVQNYEIAKGIPEEERFSSRVGFTPSVDAPTRKHSKQRKSLENALNKKEAMGWFDAWETAFGKGVDLTAEYKYDGAATVLRYVDGKLVLGLSRGDGETGEDITHHVVMYAPKTIDAVGEVEVEGETVISARDLNIVERYLDNKYASPRAAAAGMLMRKHYSIMDKHLRFVPYGISMEGIEGMSQSDRLKLLSELGFKTGAFFACTPGDAEETFSRMVKMQHISTDFDCDGIVFKINDPEKQAILGETNHSPRWAFAYKKPPDIKLCTLLSVEFSIGRGGEISPVAKITPTSFDGTVVTSAYLHSEKRMMDRGIAIGSVYEIYRSGDVIPHLGDCVTRNTNAPEVQFPKTCPCCDSEVVKSGETYYCSKRGDCPGATEAKLIFAVSRDALNIEGMGEVMVKNLFEMGYLKNVADLYSLTPGNIIDVNCGEQVARDIIKEINESKDASGYRFLMALSIPGVGKATARAIAANVGAIKDFLKWTDAKEITAKKVSGVGAVTAKAIANFLSNEETAKIASRLLSQSNMTGIEEVKTGRNYIGITNRVYVFTGTFSKGKEALEEMVISRGGQVSSTVSTNTACVVRGESPGKKLQLAHSYGIPVIDEAEFLQRVANCAIVGGGLISTFNP